MALFQFKGIKAKRLNIQAVRKRVLQALEDEGREVEREMAETIATWQGEKPDFESIVDISGGGASVLTGPVGSELAVNKWVWLDEGTKAHDIRAKRKPRLRYRKGGFRAKTKPGSLRSGAGQKATGPWRGPAQVRHPGTAARNWTAILTKQRKGRFIKRMNQAIKIGIDNL